jgi:His-Xaa-Ser system radical SAM maturase HxsC
MKSLQLQGRVRVEGFPEKIGRQLVRLADPHSAPAAPADAAIVRSQEHYDAAIAAGFTSAILIDNKVTGGPAFERIIRCGPGYEWLAPGDIMAVEPRTGRYRVLWRHNTRHNAFLVTDRCDHYCLMCSQPPKNKDDGWIIDEIHDCLKLVSRDATNVIFTGGEPFLDWPRFIPVVNSAQTLLPNALVHVLSNGRAFARPEVVQAWSGLDRNRTCLGIPIYSAVDSVHDYVVQSRGALDETVLGILRLKEKGNRVEVRIVLHQLTIPRLIQTCEWLGRNLPFIDHIALMGMEDTGFALANHNTLWMDPVDYGEILTKGVTVLANAGLRVSVFNLPLCVLPETVRSYAVRSISDWKNAHPEVCLPCAEKDRCAGFFTTGRTKFSRGLAPILAG